MAHTTVALTNRFEFDDPLDDTAARTIGPRVRQLRMQQHLTQRELAERGGLSPSVISLIEGGQRMPSIRTIRKLATALGCNLMELLSLERHPDAPGELPR